jgi:two-component system, chemotaxis family, protein-glutamate methylesterase/glutaminase
MTDMDAASDLRSLNATCPDCRGPLSEVLESGIGDFRCLIGHRFSARGLLLAHSEAQERMLWAAVVALEEAAILARVTSAHLPSASRALLRQGEEKLRQAAVIRGLLEQFTPFDVEG